VSNWPNGLPFFGVYARCVKSVGRRRRGTGIADDYESQGNDRFRDAQQTAEAFNAILLRVNAGPHRAKSDRMRRQQDILRAGGNIRNTVAGKLLASVFTQVRTAAGAFLAYAAYLLIRPT
jgi:hypothetical protein